MKKKDCSSLRGTSPAPDRPWLMAGVLLVALILVSACTGTGRLQQGERLYTGAKIHIVKDDSIGSTKLLEADLKKAVTLPRPNKKILWMRPRLVIHYMFKNSRENSFGNFVANRLGQPPVLYEPKMANRHEELLTERAANDGFFNTHISRTQKEKGRKIQLHYAVQVLRARQMVHSVTYPTNSSLLTNRIHDLRPKSLVQPNQPYHLEALIAERLRLSDTLRNHGWYFFTADNLLFEADTLRTPGDLHLTLRVKNEVGDSERRRYRIAAVTVYPDYDLGSQDDSTRRQTDTLRLDCVQYVFHRLSTNPEVLDRQIALRCGEYYSNDDYQMTIFRLLNLNLYKFVNIRFEVSPEADSLLHARIFLTPYRPERIELMPSGVFSPSFYAGGRLGAAYHHRNAFRGAEALQIALNGAFLRTNKANFDFDNFLVSDASARVSLPYMLLLPEKWNLAFGTTQFGIRHEINRFQYNRTDPGRFGLSFQRLGIEGGYLWKKNRRGSVAHAANPINLGLQYSTTSDGDIRRQLINKIPEDTTGTSRALLTFWEYKPNYTFTLDQRLEPARRYMVFFRQRFAGQASGFTRSRHLPDDFPLASPLNLFFESDYRQYQRTHGRNVLAYRMAIGAGIPLRPNGAIALLDRFIIGGASSIRAFAPRTIGPGSQPRDTTSGTLRISNYTGNLLIESSLEYRVPLGRYPELAFFVDAGNIWLTSGPDATDASRFRLNRFYKELATGAGLGLRVNLGFFVLRLDLAIPLTKPYLSDGERFVADAIRLDSRTWRRENLNWNFSFGYPF